MVSLQVLPVIGDPCIVSTVIFNTIKNMKCDKTDLCWWRVVDRLVQPVLSWGYLLVCSKTGRTAPDEVSTSISCEDQSTFQKFSSVRWICIIDAIVFFLSMQKTFKAIANFRMIMCYSCQAFKILVVLVSVVFPLPKIRQEKIFS